MTRALVTQLVEALEGLANTHQQGRSVASEGAFGYVEMHVQNAEGAITEAREYLATEPKPTLKEALTQQGIKLRTEFEPKQRDSELATEPSGELAQSVEPVAWMVYVAEVQNQYVVDDIDDAQLVDDCTNHGAEVTPLYLHPPQQAKRVPMTPEHLCALADRLTPNTETGSLDYLLYARAIEAHHGITPADKPTGWDNGLSQDYCAEFGKWLASRPGARQQIKAMFDTSTPLQP